MFRREAKVVAETRFLGFWGISVGAEWGLRNRVSELMFRWEAKVVAETRFLGFWGGFWEPEKPGF
jgi:hypothetical protein